MLLMQTHKSDSSSAVQFIVRLDYKLAYRDTAIDRIPDIGQGASNNS
jgi:hypothetical protein